MPETIFWDTSAFIALGNTRDDLHQGAIKVSQGLSQSQAHVLTTDAVLVEVANAFSSVHLRQIAKSMIEAVQASVSLHIATIVHVDIKLWDRGWQLYQARNDKH